MTMDLNSANADYVAATRKFAAYFFQEALSFGGQQAERNQDTRLEDEIDATQASAYIKRENLAGDSEDAFNPNAFFGVVSSSEPTSGQFHDLSLVVFPSIPSANSTDENQKPWLVALGLGTEGYSNDLEIALLPGTRRAQLRLARQIKDKFGYESFVKSDFGDDVTSVSKVFKKEHIQDSLAKTVSKYSRHLMACTAIDDPFGSKGQASKETIISYLATYAKMRGWGSNKEQRAAIDDAIRAISVSAEDQGNIELAEVQRLVEERQYVVLQGAPGTGKTRLAKLIAQRMPNNQIFFTQFHAETTYSDFIYGFKPGESKDGSLIYEPIEGIFVEAVKRAIEVEKNGESVFLIIDEINRANLASVLGPAFYLFEYGLTQSQGEQRNLPEVQIAPGLKIDKLPQNLYVIATMNTADRSLAVVDFALRRRFAWYTIQPRVIEAEEGSDFHEEEFQKVADIFEEYAKDEELSLQPGQAYFITRGGESIKDRLRYEVMPLIKEYLLDGLLPQAKNDFMQLFRELIDEEMFE